MSRFLFILSVCRVIISVLINILAVNAIFIPSGFEFYFPMVLGVFIVFGSAVLQMQKKVTTSKNASRMEQRIDQQEQVREIMLNVWRPIPSSIKILFVFIVIYAFSNFFSMLFFMGNEQAAFENGQYFMEGKGKFLREISKEEYLQNKGYQTSLFTGHMAMFYAAAMLFHYPKKKDH